MFAIVNVWGCKEIRQWDVDHDGSLVLRFSSCVCESKGFMSVKGLDSFHEQWTWNKSVETWGWHGQFQQGGDLTKQTTKWSNQIVEWSSATFVSRSCQT
jgi:hypothetical protein